MEKFFTSPQRHGRDTLSAPRVTQAVGQLRSAGAVVSPPRTTALTAQIRNGLATNDATETPLHIACATGAQNVEGALAILRANPQLINELDRLGNSPLHRACAAEPPSIEVVHALLLAGAHATLRNEEGLAPFHIACMNVADADHKLKRFLIFKGAQNPNLRTGRGETVAHLCASNDIYTESLKFLSSVGVDMTTTALLTAGDGTSQRMTPLDVARKHGREAVNNRNFLESLS